MTRTIQCPECCGDKYVEYDDPRPDYVHGGHIASVSRICEVCDGVGEITEDEDEGEA